MKYLMLLLALTQAVYADDVVYVVKGQPSPIDGFAITVDKAKSIRLLDLNYQFEQKKTEALTEENSILNSRLTNAQNENTSLSKELVEQRDSGFFSKVGFFVLGSVVTGFLAYGVVHTVK